MSVIAKPDPIFGYFKQQTVKGFTRSLKKVYLLQDEENLQILKDAKSTAKPLHTINLLELKDVQLSRRYPQILDLSMTDGAVFYLEIPSDSSLSSTQWINLFKKWNEYLKYSKMNKAPTTSNNLLTTTYKTNNTFEEATKVVPNKRLSQVIEQDLQLATERDFVKEIEEKATSILNKLNVIKDLKDEIDGMEKEMESINRKLLCSVDTVRTTYYKEKDGIQHEYSLNREKIANLEKSLRQVENQYDAGNKNLRRTLIIGRALEIYLGELENERITTEKELAADPTLNLATNDRVTELQAKLPAKDQVAELLTTIREAAMLQTKNEAFVKEADVKAKRGSKLELIERITLECEETEEALDSIRKDLMSVQHISQDVLDEYESVKEKYFFSLALGLKLSALKNNHRSTGLDDLAGLYDKAILESPDWVEWDAWLTKATIPKPLTIGPTFTLSSEQILALATPVGALKDL